MHPVDADFHAGYLQGYQRGLGDGSGQPPTAKRKYLFAAGTLAVGVGGAIVTGMLFSEKYRDAGMVLAFSTAVLTASLTAANILVQERPTVPGFGVRI